MGIVIVFCELLDNHHRVGQLRKDLQTGSVIKDDAGKFVLFLESNIARSICIIDLG